MATYSEMTSQAAEKVRRWAPRLVAFGEFIDGYDLLVMGAALLFIGPQMHVTAAEKGWLAAIAFIGTALGLVVFGDLSDRLGRKIIFMVNLALFVVASLLSAFVTDVWQLMIARFVIGIAVGMDIPTSHSFLAEIAPSARRGRVAGSLPNLMWLGGAIASVLLALALQPFAGADTWRWLFGLAALPALAVLIARQFLPESPRWLRAHGRADEARAIFAALGLPEPTAPVVVKREYRNLLTGRALWRLLAVTGFFALNGFAGAVATIAGPMVLASTGLGTSGALEFALAGFCVALVAVFLGSLIIDNVDRRKMGIYSCLAVFCVGMCMAFFGQTNTVVLLVTFVAYSMLTWFGPGVLSWVWSSEAFPTELRALGSGIAQCVTRLAIALNLVLAPVLLHNYGLRAIALYSCGYLGCALIAVASPFLNTTNRELESV
ncbi:MFS transporter [Burkholderia lata]|uniref:General substrate transporter n=1 Tax=Burkholderia lata (strain ATCC 17760 / DSM 23089 / LMG 22485 / NCIMB 9086 / R18194 / 383) TaxID=482957 RepID=A0A6P2NU85_BURL3|nr:MFS transporter [Burkholderia lata]VWB98518.1 general substrate transporter [Burkholderia lata]